MSTTSVTEELAVTMCGLKFVVPFMNGGGTAKTLEDVQKFSEMELIGAIEVGGVTVEPNAGNTGNTFAYFGWGSLNSIGLQNGGIPQYKKELPTMVRMAHEAGKPLFLNMSGFTPEENGEITKLAVSSEVDVAVFNSGCPNARSGEKQKPTIGLDFSLTEEHIDCIQSNLAGSNTLLAVKSTHYSNVDDRARFAELCRKKGVQIVIACNTMPNVSMYENDELMTTPNNGYAGGGGKMAMPSAIAHVRKYREILGPDVGIIGLGGLETGDDLHHYLLAGANVGASATEFYRTDNSSAVPYRILERYLIIKEAAQNRLI